VGPEIGEEGASSNSWCSQVEATEGGTDYGECVVRHWNPFGPYLPDTMGIPWTKWLCIKLKQQRQHPKSSK
jgi:hypothetical protein